MVGMNTTINTPEMIEAYRLLALKGALKLECLGMQMSRGMRASVLVREALASAGYRPERSKAKLLTQYEAVLKDSGILA
tara:strand:+ start:478 stop:714 length:237 start_codon:yes stop_codon:yes gene_type:complete